MNGQELFGLLVLGVLLYFVYKRSSAKTEDRYVVYDKSDIRTSIAADQPAKSTSSNGCLWVIGIFVALAVISQLGNSDSSSSNQQTAPAYQGEPDMPARSENACRIATTTWAAISEVELDRLVKYSVNQETDLIESMLLSGRVIQLDAGTKVFLEDAGLMQHEIRLPNTGGTLWVVAEHVKCN